MLIKCPANCKAERSYIIKQIFSSILGINCSIEFTGINNYEIIQNEKTLEINDDFFKNRTTIEDLYNKNNIPQKVLFTENQFTAENNIPVIYGNDKLKVQNNKIYCGIDIFGSAFFMLSRWEEYAVPERDAHGRFQAKNSLAKKSGFLERPVVNEYAQMLFNMLEAAGFNIEKNKRKFRVFITHDIDDPLYSLRNPIRIILADLLKRKNIKRALASAKNLILSKINIKHDFFNTFSYLMDQSEKNNFISHFFFMGASKGRYDEGYSVNNFYIKNIINEIKSRGHIIGIHPGYNSFNDEKIWNKQLNKLEMGIGRKISCGRQHFLNFSVPFTWEIWEQNNMEWDSSLAFAEELGFRAGICQEFNVFNILKRIEYRLKELPPTVMDISLSYGNISLIQPDAMKNTIIEYINKVKKYNGDFVFLWHNANINFFEWKKFIKVYEDTLVYLEGVMQ